MQHEKQAREVLDAVHQELAATELALAEAHARLVAATKARSGASAAASDKDLRRLRDDEEVAAERVTLATRDRDVVMQRVVNLEHDLRFAVDADNEIEIAARLAKMRVHVHAASALRRQANAIDTDLIGPLFDEYIDLAGIRGQAIDPRYNPPDNRPRSINELYEGTSRLAGFPVPSQFERTAAGAFLAESDRRHEAWQRADLAAKSPTVVYEDEPTTPQRPAWRADPPPKPNTDNPFFSFDTEGAT